MATPTDAVERTDDAGDRGGTPLASDRPARDLQAPLPGPRLTHNEVKLRAQFDPAHVYLGEMVGRSGLRSERRAGTGEKLEDRSVWAEVDAQSVDDAVREWWRRYGVEALGVDVRASTEEELEPLLARANGLVDPDVDGLVD